MNISVEQFKELLDSTVRDAISKQDDIPEEQEVRQLYESFYDSFILVYPDVKKCPRSELINELVTRFCEDLAVKKKLGFDYSDDKTRPWLGALNEEKEINWYYWNRYKTYLLRDKKWSPAAVRSVNKDSYNILDLMQNPKTANPFERRGLVVASVQSGKTANYIGLICRAADVGYKIIIVMAGVHNVLRNQTQARLEDGFTGFNIVGGKSVPVGVGKRDSSHRPVACTSRDADFNKNRAEALRAIQTSHTDAPWLFVIKKNSNSLKQVAEWLKDSANPNDPVLLIDDEADNASINGKYKLEKREDEPTKINGQIRNIFNHFTKGCYVGYTATPFANILIDPTVDTDEHGKDLFPSSFIYTLEESSDYFGASKVFGDYDEPRPKHLRFITDSDDILPVKHKSDFEPSELPESLKHAIRTFMVATTIRSLRSDKPFHSTMMINASPYKKPQKVVAGLARDYLQQLNAAARNNGLLPVNQALGSAELRSIKESYEREYPDCGYTWEQIQPKLYDKRYNVVCVNTDSNDVFEYESDYKHVIAVGGYRLSRGLTLEGLVVSYYSRNARAYDALMQMARWFGYRPGYEDLCRVWMTDQAAGWYKFVADSTESLFDQLRDMRQVNSTPMDYVLKIRQCPDSLTVTARNKMGAAQVVRAPIDLNAGFVETVAFDRSEEAQKANKDAALGLLKAIEPYRDFGDDVTYQYLYSRVPVEDIKAFLESYKNEDTASPKSQLRTIENYIDDGIANDELGEWDVLLAHGGASEKTIDVPGIDNPVNMERRYPGSYSSDTVLFAGEKRRLSSRGVEQAGLSGSDKARAIQDFQTEKGGDAKNCSDLYFRRYRTRPLLIIHPVCLQFSSSQRERKGSVPPLWWGDWEHEEDAIGWSVSFPKTARSTAAVDYVLNSTISEYEDSDDDFEDDTDE